MTTSTNIAIMLAAGDGGTFEIVIVLLFIVISIVGGIIKKASEKQKQKQQKGRPPAKQPRPTGQGEQAQQGQPSQRPTPQGQAPQRQVSARPAQRQPVRVALAHPQAAAKPEDLSANVQTELATQQQRLQKAGLSRRRRLAARKPPEADSAAIEKRLTSIKPEPTDETAQTQQEHRQIVRLLGRNQARQAIIYHEIFSPPKALREGREMWDT